MSALHGLDSAVRRFDAWRTGPRAPATQPGSYKEWTHFCVRLPTDPPGHLLFNLNVTERALPSGVVRTPRLLALAHGAEWVGHVESFPEERVVGAPGQVDLAFGRNRVTWRGDRFLLELHTDALSAELELRPAMLPTGTSSVSFGPGHTMHWIAVPRLWADGVVRVGERRFRLDHALAYHDHNWGHFRWGADLSWEWGFVHPLDAACPYSVILLRVSDGHRHRTLNQGLGLWRDGRLVRTFMNHEVSVRLEGAHAGPRPLTLPGVLGLLLPGAASGVPASLTMSARGQGDRLEVSVRTESKSRIAVPSDVDPLRLVLLNETTGSARVRGRARGQSFDFAGAAIVEYVRG